MLSNVDALSPLATTPPSLGCRSFCQYHVYVVQTDKRSVLVEHLRKAGIGTGIHYPHPVHRQPGLTAKARICDPLTTTEEISGKILSLPLFPAMTREAQDRVIMGVRSFFG
jgi:dTDP-4-amino-4,6-dideoxygalactose transaminase